MHNPYQQKVQQRLAHSRLMLEMYKECGETLPDKQRKEALLDAAMMHLGSAYFLYIKELGYNHQLQSIDKTHSLDQLQYLLDASGINDTHAGELSRLEQDGWLSDMLNYWSSAVYPNLDEASSDLAVPANLLVSSSNTTAQEPLTEALIKTFTLQLSQLTERQRHSNLEY